MIIVVYNICIVLFKKIVWRSVGEQLRIKKYFLVDKCGQMLISENLFYVLQLLLIDKVSWTGGLYET